LKKIVLLLGGARSGKSQYALEYARNNATHVLFVATATAGDEDMHLRIERHKQDRPPGWHTLEAATNVGTRIEENAGDAQLVIIDCITMLINNILCRFDEKQFDTISEAMVEQDVMAEIKRLQNSMEKVNASFLIISNEVGLGLVPGNRVGRLFRDFLGRVNQMLAQQSDEVYLLVAGIPICIKSGAVP
jgi:adenosylcobinamide kinase/adenosylcobinamide-phosphate guanylyltransferase